MLSDMTMIRELLDGKAEMESRPPTSNAKGLRLFSEMTLTSSKAMELLEFSVLWIRDWILLIFIFNIADTMHLSS